ncbi:NAD(P)/FAD-dependent oxidoreductase [Roseomonas marmotae]|uniref:FAD-binding oxidoreductase n=1 Tax=Roseomonas marmotae TaxID=2768161 RepID=A0ABS3K7J1_9PROT|nr:FAD-binding oxidoreductase [Roseomonas marmotae]MBO1073422.1 FAD-binding oxidoreductase [Roseomonas marmotae]QTI80383.1 FAD-binding oxidoreductase [Roseomonas marmotae]
MSIPSSLRAPDFQARPYWWDAAEPPKRANPLPDRAAVAIVGGGYAGLSAALTLRRLGHEVVVLDAERIGWGASSRNGGAVSGGLKLAAGDLARRHGEARARAILETAAASFPFIEELIAREGIDCDYVRCGRFSAAWTPADYRSMEARAGKLAALTGHATRMVPRERQREALGSDHYHGGMIADGAGSLHPGKYARGLAQAAERAGAVLVDGVRVSGIRQQGGRFRLDTDQGEMAADSVLVATNGYSRGPKGGSAGSAMPWLARRLMPIASYIIATEPLEAGLADRLFPQRRVVGDGRRVLNYFRASPDGTRVIWGGRASFRDATAEEAAPTLHGMMTEVFPELRNTRITHAWNGNVAFTFDFLPHIGVQDGVHYAAGCQGSGVAMASWLGHNAALKLAGAANHNFALDSLHFPTMPLYDGTPWFLPLVGGWYRLRDRIDRMRA